MKKINVALMVLGSLTIFLGICLLLNSLYGKGAHKDVGDIAIGGMVFSFGCLLLSGGFYLSTRTAVPSTAGTKGTSTVASKKFKVGNCALCKLEAAVVRC